MLVSGSGIVSPVVLPSFEELLAAVGGDLLAENARLRTSVAELGEQLAAALGRVEELAARLKMSSKNSSRPPAADGLAKPAPKSLRKKSGRGPGRPQGQPGVTLEPVEVPDHTWTYQPLVCAGCGGDLAGARVVGVESR